LTPSFREKAVSAGRNEEEVGKGARTAERGRGVTSRQSLKREEGSQNAFAGEGRGLKTTRQKKRTMKEPSKGRGGTLDVLLSKGGGGLDTETKGRKPVDGRRSTKKC